jgi:hypothetical protein
LKQHNIPREDVVIMTKVYFCLIVRKKLKLLFQLYGTVSRDGGPFIPWEDAEARGYINQHGLSRKVVMEYVVLLLVFLIHHSIFLIPSRLA